MRRLNYILTKQSRRCSPSISNCTVSVIATPADGTRAIYVRMAILLFPIVSCAPSCSEASEITHEPRKDKQYTADLVEYPLWLAPKYSGRVDRSCKVDQSRSDAMSKQGWTLVNCAQKEATFVRTALLDGKLTGSEVSQPEKITIVAEISGGYWESKFKVFMAYPSDISSTNYIISFVRAESLDNIKTFGSVEFDNSGNAIRFNTSFTVAYNEYKCNFLHQIYTYSIPQTRCIWNQATGPFILYYGHRLDFNEILETIQPVREIRWDIWQ